MHAENQLEDSQADVRQVCRTFNQQRTGRLPKQRRGRLGCSTPGKRCAFALGNQRLGLIEQARVIEQFLMSLEDFLLSAASRRVAQVLQGHLRLDQRVRQRLLFRFRPGAGLFYVEAWLGDLHDLAPCRTGRCTDSTQNRQHLRFDALARLRHRQRCDRFPAPFGEQP